MRNFVVKRVLAEWEKRNQAVLKKRVLPNGVTEILDLPYGPDPAHRLNLYYPEEHNGKLPVLLDIHGGGFLYGDKELNRGYGYEMALRGFFVCSINYRLAFQTATVPQQVQDVARAAAWLACHLDEYPADRNCVCLSGDSAGAVLAFMEALRMKSSRLRRIYQVGEAGLTYRAVFCNCPFTDFDADVLAFRELRKVCFGLDYKTQEAYHNLCIPRLPELSELPPVFIASGRDDLLGMMATRLDRILSFKKIKHKTMVLPRGREYPLEHVVSITHPEYPESQTLLTVAANYLFEQIKGTEHPATVK